MVERVLANLGPFTSRDHHSRHAELGHDLATASARIGAIDAPGVDASHCHDVDLADALGHCGVDCRRLGTRGHGICRVLDICAGEHLAVFGDQDGSDPET